MTTDEERRLQEANDPGTPWKSHFSHDEARSRA
jgi:hypothetical protein